jgi:hypothetical protein
MKRIFTLLSALLLCGGLQAQEKLSANVGLGLGVPYVKLDQTDYIGYKPNLALTGGLGYQLDKYFRVRGDILYGYLNGNDDLTYFQSNIGEANLALEVNILRYLDDNTNFKFNLVGGVGMGVLHSNLYSRASRNRIQEIPSNRNGTYSLMWHTIGGANIGIPLSPKLDLNMGYHHRFSEDNDWLDATDSPELDSYGMVKLGLTFHLKHVIPKGKVEVDKKRYQNLRQTADNLKGELEVQDNMKEKVARLEMNVQEKDLMISDLQSKVDNLQQLKDKREVASVDEMPAGAPSRRGATPSEKQRQASLGKKQYRIVVASLASRSMAERYRSNSNLDKSEMITVYVEKVDSYRVIYKSRPTYPAAKKELQSVKRKVPDAWIAKF